MSCYIIPTTTAIALFFMRKKNHTFKGKHNLWLNQLLLGGAIFGVIDHWWNGELFLFGGNFLLDLALGVTITLTILFVWVSLVVFDKLAHKHQRATKS